MLQSFSDYALESSLIYTVQFPSIIRKNHYSIHDSKNPTMISTWIIIFHRINRNHLQKLLIRSISLGAHVYGTLFIFQEYFTKFNRFHNKQLTLKDYSFGSVTLESASSAPYLLYILVGSFASSSNAVVSFPTQQSASRRLLSAIGSSSSVQYYIAARLELVLIITLLTQNHVG